MIIKCKMCGGDLHPVENATTCECEFCGTTQTIPKLDNERRLNLYDRANHFRRNNEYDKAMGIFEQILQDDRTDAEAYWSLVLCRYGIEYVEDPASGKRIPTVNRAQFTSIFADDDYKSALEYADAVQKSIYEEEAKAIDNIQKGILDISKKEKPFDVFICYKETDAEGKRTPDSVLANDLYHQLTREGFKVFFSRITLEDKLGQQYEPYIFAALNSAKVMVVLGTKPEYFNAVWVKNEWSRYLKLIKNGANKTLVPAYKDMDPYDLPEEFSHLQAQDMSKLGFMQDLIHGIKKIAGEDKPAPAQQPVAPIVVDTPMKANIQSLIGRAFMALEDGEWTKADDFCEQALNQDFQNARAYIGKLMAELKVRKEDDLQYQTQPIDTNGNFQKALRFADDKTKTLLTEINNKIKNRNEQNRLKNQYDEAMNALKAARSVSDVRAVKNRLSAMTGYKDTAKGLKACDEKIESLNSVAYSKANELMKQQQYAQAAAAFRAISDYRDSKSAAARCDQLEKERLARKNAERAEQEKRDAVRKAKEEAERKEKERIAAELKARQEEIARREAEAKAAKTKKIGIIVAIAAAVCVAAFFLVTKVILPKTNYDNAVKAMQAGQYDTAITAFTELGDYEDSNYRLEQTQANKAFDAGQYATVNSIYNSLPENYQDHAGDLMTLYNDAVDLMDAGNYDEAVNVFAKLGDYSDSKTQMSEAIYRKACSLKDAGDCENAAALFSNLQDYKDSTTIIAQIDADRQFDSGDYKEAWTSYAALPVEYQTHNADYADMYASAEALLDEGCYDEAAVAFKALGDYADSKNMINECSYRKAGSLAAVGDYNTAITLYESLNGYSDSVNLAAQAKADLMYANGQYDEADIAYNALDEQYRTHTADIAAMYGDAEALLENGSYDEAAAAFEALGNYSDSKNMINECAYRKAGSLAAASDYNTAITLYESLNGYSDSVNLAAQAKADLMYANGQYDAADTAYNALDEQYRTHTADIAAMYGDAEALLENGSYDEAAAAFEALGNYSDSKNMINECAYRKAGSLAAAGSYDAAIALYEGLSDYSDSVNLTQKTKADKLYAAGSYADAYAVYAALGESYQSNADGYTNMYANAVTLQTNGQYDEAIDAFTALGMYSDSTVQILQSKYLKAGSLVAAGSYDEAIAIYSALGEYSDSVLMIEKAKADKLYDADSYADAYAVYATLDDAYHTHETDYAAMYAAAETTRISGDYDNAREQFITLGAYSDAKDKAVQCVIDKADSLFTAEKYDKAAEVYASLGDDANEKLSIYKHAGQLAAQGEYKLAADRYFMIFGYEDSQEQHYQMGLQARESGKLADAYNILSEDAEYRDTMEVIYQIGVAASVEKRYEISVPCFTFVGAYKDAAMKLSMDTYAWGGQLYENGDYDKSAEVFASMGEFSDSPARANEARYAAASEAMANGAYDDAAARYAELGDYSDSTDKAKAARYAAADELLKAGEFADAKARFIELGDYNDSTDKVKECDYLPARASYDAQQFSDALTAFKGLAGYKDSDTIMNDCRYQLGKAAMTNGDYTTARDWFDAAGDYSDSKDQAAECRRLIALAEAQTYESAGEYEAAYAQYELASETEKMQEMAYQTALVKLSESNYVDAIAWYEKAGTYSDAKEQILSIGEYYYATQQYNEAEIVYVKVLGIGNAAQRLYELGQYYELVGNLERAARCYSEAGDYQDAPDKAVALQNEVDYQSAESLFLAQDWEGAKQLYAKIPGYKDVDSKVTECDNAIPAARKAEFTAVGNVFTFGHYEQDNNTSNGKEAIEWQVLEVKGNTVLVISKYTLDAKQYHSSYAGVTWEKSSIRTWLNGTFLNAAFTANEQISIETTTVDNSKSQGYSGYNTNGGNNTQDKIFLLSYAEAWKYFKTDRSRASTPTKYAKSQSNYSNMWGLRSPGYTQDYAASVFSDGSRYSGYVNYTRGVRPAFWINLESGIFKSYISTGVWE